MKFVPILKIVEIDDEHHSSQELNIVNVRFDTKSRGLQAWTLFTHTDVDRDQLDHTHVDDHRSTLKSVVYIAVDNVVVIPKGAGRIATCTI